MGNLLNVIYEQILMFLLNSHFAVRPLQKVVYTRHEASLSTFENTNDDSSNSTTTKNARFRLLDVSLHFPAEYVDTNVEIQVTHHF